MAVRRPAVAGTFYPAQPAVLEQLVDQLLAEAGTSGTSRVPHTDPLRADSPPTEYSGPNPSRTASPAATAPIRLGAWSVIAPHAGYVYSGSTAAVAYRHLRRDGIERVAVLGPTHRVPLRGVATSSASAWSTPHGEARAIVPPSVAALPQVVVSDEAHAPEHSIEVHVPFLQRLLPQADLVPLAVGRATPSEVADVVDALLDDPATVVVISSDLSHYLPYDAARRLDRDTIDQVTALRGDLDHEQACGATPINGLMEHARRRGGTIRALASCSSGDTAGDRDRVVGYAALALEEKAFEETAFVEAGP